MKSKCRRLYSSQLLGIHKILYNALLYAKIQPPPSPLGASKCRTPLFQSHKTEVDESTSFVYIPEESLDIERKNPQQPSGPLQSHTPF